MFISKLISYYVILLMFVYVSDVCAGHAKAVRDVCFNIDGTQFLSCSYDRYIKLWDTETGQLMYMYIQYSMYVCIYHVCYHRLYIHTRNGLAMPRYIVYVTSLGFLRTVTARGKLAGVTNDKLL